MFNLFKSGSKEEEFTIKTISGPVNVQHKYHCVLCAKTNRILGLPERWEKIVNDSIPVEKRNRETLIAAVKVVDFLENGISDVSVDLSDIEDLDTPPELPERNKTANSIPTKSDRAPKNYVNVDIKSKLKKLQSDEEIEAEIKRMCHHKNEYEYEKYADEKEIGEGASGKVYVALDKNTNQKVAIKDMVMSKQRNYKNVLSELILLKRFKHENIVGFLDSFYVESPSKSLRIVTEFMDGGALTDLVMKTELEEPKIAAISFEILKGLDFLHDKNIIHRDIKSDNILLHTDGTVKIADLGFSVNVAVNEKRNTAVGTPYWMSPELV